MNIMYSPNSLALLLLCSQVGLPKETDLENRAPLSPLTLREYNHLARRLLDEGLRPGDLLGWTADHFQSRLSLTSQEADRLASLLGRVEPVEKALDSMASSAIYPLTRADPDYPALFRQRLKDAAPVVLFYAGEKALLGQPGIAVVGSRNLDEAGVSCAEFVGNACGLAGLVLYSGGARGVDTLSMQAALAARGTAVGILADSLSRAVRLPENRLHLEAGNLCLVIPYNPDAGFSVGGAMGRNRLIYTLADFAIVVASDAGKGGTWAGASEALKAGWVPVFALQHERMPEGNRQLIEKGALPFPHPYTGPRSGLYEWLKKQSPGLEQPPKQMSLF